MARERFSLILLEPGEVYFEDFASNLIVGGKVRQEVPGRLKMCSKSIVFDPKDQSRPIVKVPYKECTTVDVIDEKQSRFDDPRPYLRVMAKQYVELLENNEIAPYKFISQPQTFVFHFEYVRIQDYLPQFGQLHRASSLPVAEQNSMIATIVYSRHNRVKFNPLWLEHLTEETICDFPVDEIRPLVVNPGRLLLTTYGVYFQSYNNIYSYPVKKIPIKRISGVIRRRFLLRQVGLEINWNGLNTSLDEYGDQQLLYVAFKFDCDRDQFYNSLVHQQDYQVQVKDTNSITLQWQNGVISNYDYLLYLNSLADRSFYDLTQYPVFPWVISDYNCPDLDLQDESVYRDLTKPMGAQNPDRLAKLLDRFEEMGDPKFLYGSHYSTPGFVLFYLVRKFPQLMLCLCYGKFDHPDRMFNSVAEVYKNCLMNMSDFKELTPEFYDTRRKGDFLCNTLRINYGVRADGTPVNNVELPGWADKSPEKFVQKLRDALESTHVSKNIHHWIDLIFGYKQKGDEAITANNLFYYLCYEGSVDLDDIDDIAKRHALEVQISEFGQIPKQLFTQPHVPRIVDIPQAITLRKDSTAIKTSTTTAAGTVEDDEESPVNDDDVTRRWSIDDGTGLRITGNVTLDYEYQPHRLQITSVLYDAKTQMIYSTGHDGTLKAFDLQKKSQSRSVNLGCSPISSCVRIPETAIFVMGLWDNTLISYDMDYCQVVNTIPAHDDAVSCISYVDRMGFLVTGSWDCTVKLWKGFTRSHAKSFRKADSVLACFTCNDKITCLDSRLLLADHNGKINIVIGTDAGTIFIWSIDQIQLPMEESVDQNANQVLQVTNSSGGGRPFASVKGLLFNHNGTKIACCDDTGRLVVYFVHDTSSICRGCANVVVLLERQLEGASQLGCMSWSFGTNQLMVADARGVFYVWDMAVGKLGKQWTLHQGAITAINYLDETRFITAGQDTQKHCVKVWKCD